MYYCGEYVCSITHSTADTVSSAFTSTGWTTRNKSRTGEKRSDPQTKTENFSPAPLTDFSPQSASLTRISEQRSSYSITPHSVRLTISEEWTPASALKQLALQRGPSPALLPPSLTHPVRPSLLSSLLMSRWGRSLPSLMLSCSRDLSLHSRCSGIR
ncbi:hypothetical protein AOLI_G00135820 [Acnodon oligacanthus]